MPIATPYFCLEVTPVYSKGLCLRMVLIRYEATDWGMYRGSGVV